MPVYKWLESLLVRSVIIDSIGTRLSDKLKTKKPNAGSASDALITMNSQHVTPRIPIVYAAYLFRCLCKLYRATVVCDVGSFDGCNAMDFLRPGTRVLALEANPTNFESMVLNSRVADAGIEVFHLAAWNKDENISFNVVARLEGVSNDWRSKISSIRSRSRSDFNPESRQVTVRATRLDTFLLDQCREIPGSIALWIDVEGVGFEVLEGITGILDDVGVIHIEVETNAYWDQQHLWPDVLALMREYGFSAVARSSGDLQFDVVFINDGFRRASPIATGCLIALFRARRLAGLMRGFVRSRLDQRVRS